MTRSTFFGAPDDVRKGRLFAKLNEIAQNLGGDASDFTQPEFIASNKDLQDGVLWEVLNSINTALGTERGANDGLGQLMTARATFNPSGVTGQRTIAAHGLGVTIPNKAIIVRAYYDVITTFTSAADTATIALKVQSANDAVSAIAIGDTTNPWDAGIHGTILGFPNFGADAAHDSALEVAALFAGVMLKTTAARELTATVAVQALTAGKLILFVDYVQSA